MCKMPTTVISSFVENLVSIIFKGNEFTTTGFFFNFCAFFFGLSLYGPATHWQNWQMQERKDVMCFFCQKFVSCFFGILYLISTIMRWYCRGAGLNLFQCFNDFYICPLLQKPRICFSCLTLHLSDILGWWNEVISRPTLCAHTNQQIDQVKHGVLKQFYYMVF